MGRAAVIGAAGFIGSHLSQYLAAKGTKVIAIDRRPMPGDLPVMGVRAEFPGRLACDTLASNQVDQIFLLAGTNHPAVSVSDPLGDLVANARDTLAFLEFMKGRPSTPTIVFVSSAAVYGEASRLPLTEQSPTRPISPYGVSKLAAELYARIYADQYGLRTIVVRPFSVYGPRLRKQVVWDILQKLHGHGDPTLDGSGAETRDFVYVTDLCRALVRVADAGKAGTVYNICSGREISIASLSDTLSGLVGRPPLHFTGIRRVGDPKRWLGDASRLATLGWKPDIDLHQGLSATVAWYWQSIASPTLTANGVR